MLSIDKDDPLAVRVTEAIRTGATDRLAAVLKDRTRPSPPRHPRRQGRGRTPPAPGTDCQTLSGRRGHHHDAGQAVRSDTPAYTRQPTRRDAVTVAASSDDVRRIDALRTTRRHRGAGGASSPGHRDVDASFSAVARRTPTPRTGRRPRSPKPRRSASTTASANCVHKANRGRMRSRRRSGTHVEAVNSRRRSTCSTKAPN